MSEEKTHHSHDRIFRHAMSLPLVARQFLETWMPKEFLALVEWGTLRVEKISGISEALAERREDLLYRIEVSWIFSARPSGAQIWNPSSRISERRVIVAIRRLVGGGRRPVGHCSIASRI